MSFSHNKGGSSYAIYRAQFNGTTWTMPATENAELAAGSTNRVAMNAAGKIVSMWQTYDDVVHFQEDSGSGWEAEYTFNPGHWVSVEKMELFMSSLGEVVAVWPDSNLIKFYKKSGTAAVVAHSIAAPLSQFSIKKSDEDSLAIAWNTSSQVKYARCDFSSCDTVTDISNVELDAQGNPVTKLVKNFDATPDRISIFWERTSRDVNGLQIKETAGAEESSEWPLQLLAPIHYQTL